MKSQGQLASSLENFVGKRCIGHVAGGAAGSHVSLEFGQRVQRLRPLSNPALSEEQRLTEAEYSVFVLCSWRLDSEFEVICGAWDDNSEGGPMLKGLDLLIGRRLDAFNLIAPGLDLELRFGNISFRIFCDNVNEDDKEDNYSLFLPAEIVTIATRSRMEREQRSVMR